MPVRKPPLDLDDTDVAARSDDRPIGDALAQHHRGLERAFEAILARSRTEDPVMLRRAWDVLERELTTHMEFEEKELFPGFERFHADDALILRGEHDVIRKTLAEVGRALDLHRLTETAILHLATYLRAHALREDLAFYPWTERHLSREVWPPLGHELSDVELLAHINSWRN